MLAKVVSSRCLAAKPFPYFSHDFVDLERLQGSWFFFKLETPSDQELVFASFRWLLFEFINNLLNRRLPIFQVHPHFLCDVGVFRWSIPQMSPSYMPRFGIHAIFLPKSGTARRMFVT